MSLERIAGVGAPGIDPAEKLGGAEGAAAGAAGSAGAVSGPSFGDILRDALSEANRLQSSADQAIERLASGEETNVAEVMTAVEKADLAFRTLMQVRTKLVDAYDELMRLRI